MAESNASLAMLVYRLRDQLASLQDVVNRLTAGASEHEHPLLAQEMAALTQILRGHIEAEEERTTSQSAPRWDGLGEDEYREQLGQLAEFVDGHLRVAYGDYWRDALRDCWPGHPQALWELGNLRAEWNRTYDRDHPSLTGALNWHDRWMPGARDRLRGIMSGCRAGHCVAKSGRSR
ncbi:MAG: hypothetical protein ACRDPY_04060 [Streptosporangiaceae bacterium]